MKEDQQLRKNSLSKYHRIDQFNFRNSSDYLSTRTLRSLTATIHTVFTTAHDKLIKLTVVGVVHHHRGHGKERLPPGHLDTNKRNPRTTPT